ncbi:uncharacterized protein BDZ99DRAFT_455170 [Mytilinidion resinicola]|uniref:Uncharacterized protein n=1 Tax=Mytilinidion resinicola TaxID=574789 RepID=A0A6A6XZV0_9PEZI|nr:uncharacterized protein BDZ99DRAFT_455170 [Mytilinidion resinicola]KAF2802052.1 hypothetical protein BDZ99DRAFT_455170 [Mytilinidion resinicola]
MNICEACKEPLVVEVDLSDDDDDIEMGGSSSAAAAAGNGGVKTVPDDIHLNCGCHFHWTCLLDSYTHTSCPSCNRDITSITSASPPQIQVVCTLTNEGGVQPNLDILPLLTEESYLKAYPEDRKARAFLEFCREGDVAAVVELLQAGDDDDDEDSDEDDDAMDETTAPGEKKERRQIDLLRYQDPIEDMQSALHAAVAGGSREVAWVLLLLASQLPLSEFPALVFQEASKLGVMRNDEEVAGKTDIRTLRDCDGRSAEDLAREMVIWNGWVGNGRLVI